MTQKPSHLTGKALFDQQAGDSPDSETPLQAELRRWDYRDGELVQLSGPKADKPQVGDKGPGCCIRMGEIRMNCKTWMGEDGMWHIHPDLEKSIREDTTGRFHGLKITSDDPVTSEAEKPTNNPLAEPRFSPKSCSPELRIQNMFDAGQKIKSKQKAKTRAGMLRKTHPAWAEAFLDGFYSRPDAPPRPLVSIEESTPYLTPAKGLFAEVIPTDPKSIVEMETVSLALEDQCRAIVTNGGSLAVRYLKRQIKRAELYAYMALLNDVLLSVDSMPVDNDIRTQVEYVAIRNFLTLTKIESWIFEVMVPIITPEPKFMNFLEEKKRIADKWASKDEAGKPILTSDEDGPSQQNLEFTQAARSSHDAELAVLHSKYADAIARQEEQTAQANVFWLKPVDIDVYCIPYSWIADRVAGCPAIMFMTTDPPSLDWPSPTLVWDPIKERGGLLNLFVSK